MYFKKAKWSYYKLSLKAETAYDKEVGSSFSSIDKDVDSSAGPEFFDSAFQDGETSHGDIT